MMGTMFCQYETPCGICTRTNNPCTEKYPRKKVKISIGNKETENKDKGAVKDE